MAHCTYVVLPAASCQPTPDCGPTEDNTRMWSCPLQGTFMPVQGQRDKLQTLAAGLRWGNSLRGEGNTEPKGLQNIATHGLPTAPARRRCCLWCFAR
jgi:hypothetical protein